MSYTDSVMKLLLFSAATAATKAFLSIAKRGNTATTTTLFSTLNGNSNNVQAILLTYLLF